MFLSRLHDYLLLTLLFLLPWQTRLIYQSNYIGDNFFEYNSLSLYGIEILAGIIVLLSIIQKLKDSEFKKNIMKVGIKIKSIILFFVLFVIFGYLIFSSNREITWQYLTWLIYAFCLFTIILESKLETKKIVTAIWSGGLVQALMAIWQFYSQQIFANKWLGMAAQNPQSVGVSVIEVFGERWLRAYGSFGWPNSLGIYLAAVFVIGLILICHSRKSGNLIGDKDTCLHGNYRALLIGQLIILTGLFFTFARGAWLGLFIVMTVILYRTYKVKEVKFHFLAYTVLVIILISVYSNLVFARFNYENRLEKQSISERSSQFVDFINVFVKYPIFGTGPGAYTTALHQIHPDYTTHQLKPVHNVYLLFLAEWGMVGLLLLFSFCYFFIKKMGIIFLPLLAVVMVAGLFDHWPLSMFTGLMFTGVIVGLSLRIRNEENNLFQLTKTKY